MIDKRMQTVFDALDHHGQQPKWKGTRHISSLCPAHSDHKPSLDVDLKDNGKVTLNCRSHRCDNGEILARIDLGFDDISDRPKDRSKPIVVAEYPYCDEHGTVLYVKERFEPKDFRQYRPEPGGRRSYKLDDVRRVLFGLPELHAAVISGDSEHRYAYLVEGEKDVLRLRGLGEPATTWSDGAWKPGSRSKWRPEYTQQLLDAGVVDVFIIRDRDKSGQGAAAAADIKAKLQRAGLNVIVQQSKVDKDGADVSDHLDAEYTIDELETVKDEDDQPSAKPPEQNGQRRIKLTWANTITPEPVRWAWVHLDQGRMPSGHLIVVGGREGTGKSQFTIWQAAQITRGTLPGELYGQPRPVIIVATEDSWKHTIIPRLIAAGADLSMVARADVVSETADNVTISLPSDISALEETIKEHGVALVILDPVLSVLGETINDHRAKDVRSALEPLVAVADRTDCLMVAIVHFNKGSGVDAMALLSGSHAFRDLPRAVFAFVATKTEKVFTQTKNNLGRSDLPSLTYTIESVTVPTPKGDAEVSKFILGGVSHRDVADLLADAADGDDSDLRNAAQDFLLSYLMSNGLAAPASKVIAAGIQNGYTADQMKNARARMRDPKVLSQKTAMGGGWEWRVEAPDD